MRWMFVAIIVAATAAGEVLQAAGMRRHGEVHDFRPGAIGRAMAALAALPREQREVIVLKLWNGLTFEAIARLFDLSPNTVAGRYRYGLSKLRGCLKAEENQVTATVAVMAGKANGTPLQDT